MILAVIPARAGSQRVPCKNRMEIEPGLHLVQQAINCAADSGIIDDVCLLTDDEQMPFHRAVRIPEPPELAGPTSDISAAVAYATASMEYRTGRIYTHVVTLQPAVLARSPLIVRRLVSAVVEAGAGGGLTMAITQPWQWSVRYGSGFNAWHPGPYPRSQECPHHFAEVNAVQVARRDAVAAGKRWGLPLLIASLPRWAADLDIDEPKEFAAARDMWAWARPRLETWEPAIHPVESINGKVA